MENEEDGGARGLERHGLVDLDAAGAGNVGAELNISLPIHISGGLAGRHRRGVIRLGRIQTKSGRGTVVASCGIAVIHPTASMVPGTNTIAVPVAS